VTVDPFHVVVDSPAGDGRWRKVGIVPGQILQFGLKPLAAADPGVVAMFGLPAGTRLWIAAGVTTCVAIPGGGGWRLRKTALYRDRHIDGVYSAV
jgi:hypothetical protein